MGGAIQEREVRLPSLAELEADTRARIVATRTFTIGRIDEFGRLIGYGEFPAGQVPSDHQAFHYDAEGRVIYFEKHSREFTKPSKRYYRYEGEVLVDSIWVDRYGRFDNYHRYVFDEWTGLMAWRAEYRQDGSLFYTIKSDYNYRAQVEDETWYDDQHRMIRRFAYAYDDRGEVVSQHLYGSRNQLEGFHTYRHDAKGNVLSRRWHAPDGTPRGGYAYTYGPKDRVTKIEALNEAGKVSLRKEFDHDAIGNVTRERWFDHENRLIKDLRF
jgi:hypothetical protein